jgi:hypothetical protein
VLFTAVLTMQWQQGQGYPVQPHLALAVHTKCRAKRKPFIDQQE